MRNVKIIVFKTVFLIEILPAVHCRHVKVYCKMFFIALGKTVLRVDTKYIYVLIFSLTIQSLQCIFKLTETKHVIFFNLKHLHHN